jgi:hypothetical protein
VTDKLWEIEDIVGMIEAWEAEQAVAGIVYEVRKDVIGEGYHVRTLPRYADPSTEFFPNEAAAMAYVERQKASHRPGRRRKELNPATNS